MVWVWAGFGGSSIAETAEVPRPSLKDIGINVPSHPQTGRLPYQNQEAVQTGPCRAPPKTPAAGLRLGLGGDGDLEDAVFFAAEEVVGLWQVVELHFVCEEGGEVEVCVVD